MFSIPKRRLSMELESRLSSKQGAACHNFLRQCLAVGIAGTWWLFLTSIGCALGPYSESGHGLGGRDSSGEIVEVPSQSWQGLAIVEGRIEGLDRPARLLIDSG